EAGQKIGMKVLCLSIPPPNKLGGGISAIPVKTQKQPKQKGVIFRFDVLQAGREVTPVAQGRCTC
ncbi:MAG: hypothetical protein ACI3ZY_00635, partial [Parabacteroides sp.]